MSNELSLLYRSGHRAIERFSEIADQCVCLLEPPRFNSVGLWYLDFDQVSEEEVVRALSSRPILYSP